ncbi:MAG: asparaginase, partial [candidate division Zixibacteria bacterium]|nr:asparaginase [candidate division Zixibacteria bacterium]
MTKGAHKWASSPPSKSRAGTPSGFPQRFGLDSRHLALVCASHSGEERHVRTAQEILAAIGAQVSDLQCGVHVPLLYRPDEGPVPAKSEFTQLHNNCSGKHSGMLALARILNCPLSEYLQVDSVVQRTIREMVAMMAGVDSADLQVGTDGCSAPNYAMPLRALAYAYARLAGAREHAGRMDSDTRQAAIQILNAMTQNPEMVSGTGRLDLAIAEASGRQFIVKAGGEAVQCIGVPDRGWGIAIKIGDGGARAVG